MAEGESIVPLMEDPETTQATPVKYPPSYSYTNDPAHLSSILVLLISVGSAFIITFIMIGLILCVWKCKRYRTGHHSRMYEQDDEAQPCLEDGAKFRPTIIRTEDVQHPAHVMAGTPKSENAPVRLPAYAPPYNPEHRDDEMDNIDPKNYEEQGLVATNHQHVSKYDWTHNISTRDEPATRYETNIQRMTANSGPKQENNQFYGQTTLPPKNNNSRYETSSTRMATLPSQSYVTSRETRVTHDSSRSNEPITQTHTSTKIIHEGGVRNEEPEYTNARLMGSPSDRSRETKVSSVSARKLDDNLSPEKERRPLGSARLAYIEDLTDEELAPTPLYPSHHHTAEYDTRHDTELKPMVVRVRKPEEEERAQKLNALYASYGYNRQVHHDFHPKQSPSHSSPTNMSDRGRA